MVSCELCGNQVNSLKNVNVSGSILKVCNACAKMGIQTNASGNKTHTFKRRIRDDEQSYEIVSNYPQLIQQALGKKDYTIHQLARGTNIKESTLNNYMKKTVKLDVETAQKIAKFLEIKLVYEVSDEDDTDVSSYYDNNDNSNGGGLSLGDLIQQKLNK